MKVLKIWIVPILFLFIFDSLAAQKIQRPLALPFTSPEQLGISSSVLDSMLHFIINTNQNIHHLAIIRNNQTVLDANFYPYSSEYLHDVASVTKSITSLLIGIAIGKGFIKSEKEKVKNYFPEITTQNPFLDSLEIKHLVTMTSGLDCNGEDGEKALGNMRKSTDWIQYIFTLPTVAKPGQSFSYCSCNYYLLGEIIYRSSHLTPHLFAKQYLFKPLEISHSKWLSNYKGINHGWGDLFLLPADMAKIGKLVLDKGKWHSNQIVPEEWITNSLKTYSHLPHDKGYGYGWWTNDKVGFYEAAGRGRQTISVIPSKNMIVTMLGGEFDAGSIGKYIFQSIHSDSALPENKKSQVALARNIESAGNKPPLKSGRVNKSLIQKLDKRMIVFERNITAIDSLQFEFVSANRGKVSLYENQRRVSYPFLLSTNHYAISFDSTFQLPVALNANFQHSDEFVLHYNQLCRINNFYFHFKINGDKVKTTMEETSNFLKKDMVSSFK